MEEKSRGSGIKIDGGNRMLSCSGEFLGATIVSIDLSESGLANDCDGQVHCTWTCLPRGWDARSGWWVAGPGGRGQLKQLRFPSAATLL
jgi:hypothetical protein